MNHPPYRIETERLVLRCWNPEDAPLLKATVDANVEHLRPWMPWVRFEPTDLETKANLLRGFRADFDLDKDYVYGVFSKDETAVWGGCGLHRRNGPAALEIGYWIAADQGGQGLATELARALTEAAFSVEGVDRVEVHHEPANIRSRRVPEKLGFTLEAIRRRTNIDFPGEFRDAVIWTKFRERLETTGADPEVLGLDHVQIAIPRGAEDRARAFYVDQLGFSEVAKPENLRKKGGFWVVCGAHQLHLGILDPFVPATKAHPALLVRGLPAYRRTLEDRGVATLDEDPLPGFERFYVADPFGNRIEFLERKGS